MLKIIFFNFLDILNFIICMLMKFNPNNIFDIFPTNKNETKNKKKNYLPTVPNFFFGM